MLTQKMKLQTYNDNHKQHNNIGLHHEVMWPQQRVLKTPTQIFTLRIFCLHHHHHARSLSYHHIVIPYSHQFWIQP